ncbi:MAG: single-stranded-DNA-specific exonuclease RecJ [Chloroflexi bacterium]|nr:single-stranded-DNA-specific exonuclease RecJ [Chloroflexota bacterium]
MVISAQQEARGASVGSDAVAARRRRWRGRTRPDSVPVGDWPELVGRLLATRGITDASSARQFLGSPSTTPSASDLPAIDVAIDRLLRAASSGEIVAVFGDFDVDGVTSAAQLTQALRATGALPVPYIPDRFTEGYGLNVPAIETLRRDGATLLLTADCGTSSIDEIARAREIGMDVIVLDHHTVPPALPDALALVNPKVPGASAGGLSELATAGLAFHTAAALHAAADKHFDEGVYLDAAALGTVCDMAPLVDENRRIMRAGLPVLARTLRPGLRSLMKVSRVDPATVTADDIGYRLGPRLNAAGRIAHAKLALELLLTEDGERGRELAQQLDALNRERQERTAQAVSLSARLVEEKGELPPLIMIGHPDFSSGIVGLIASKMVTLYGRPAVVFEKGDAFSRASCRSIDEFHITDTLRARPDLFVRFGGHRAAAGFTVETARLQEVRDHLVAHAERELVGRDLAPVLEIDAQLPLRQLRGDEIRWLMKLGPFGVGNPVPAFLSRGVTVTECRVVGNGERHLKLKLRDGGTTWPAMAFDMGDAFVEPGERIDVVYTLDARADGTLDIRVEDMRTPE